MGFPAGRQHSQLWGRAYCGLFGIFRIAKNKKPLKFEEFKLVDFDPFRIGRAIKLIRDEI